MAIKVGKKDLSQIGSLVARLTDARDAVSDAVANYNAVLEDARNLRDGLVEEWQSEYSERSERWQEGDAGQAAQEVIDAWEQMELDDIEDPEMTAPDELDSAPTEPGT